MKMIQLCDKMLRLLFYWNTEDTKYLLRKCCDIKRFDIIRILLVY